MTVSDKLLTQDKLLRSLHDVLLSGDTIYFLRKKMVFLTQVKTESTNGRQHLWAYANNELSDQTAQSTATRNHIILCMMIPRFLRISEANIVGIEEIVWVHGI